MTGVQDWLGGARLWSHDAVGAAATRASDEGTQDGPARGQASARAETCGDDEEPPESPPPLPLGDAYAYTPQPVLAARLAGGEACIHDGLARGQARARAEPPAAGLAGGEGRGSLADGVLDTCLSGATKELLARVGGEGRIEGGADRERLLQDVAAVRAAEVVELEREVVALRKEMAASQRTWAQRERSREMRAAARMEAEVGRMRVEFERERVQERAAREAERAALQDRADARERKQEEELARLRLLVSEGAAALAKTADVVWGHDGWCGDVGTGSPGPAPAVDAIEAEDGSRARGEVGRQVLAQQAAALQQQLAEKRMLAQQAAALQQQLVAASETFAMLQARSKDKFVEGFRRRCGYRLLATALGSWRRLPWPSASPDAEGRALEADAVGAAEEWQEQRRVLEEWVEQLTSEVHLLRSLHTQPPPQSRSRNGGSEQEQGQEQGQGRGAPGCDTGTGGARGEVLGSCFDGWRQACSASPDCRAGRGLEDGSTACGSGGPKAGVRHGGGGLRARVEALEVELGREQETSEKLVFLLTDKEAELGKVRAELAQARAGESLAAAEAKAALLEEHVGELGRKEALARRELDDKHKQVERLQASVEELQARVQAARVRDKILALETAGTHSETGVCVCVCVCART